MTPGNSLDNLPDQSSEGRHFRWSDLRWLATYSTNLSIARQITVCNTDKPQSRKQNNACNDGISFFGLIPKKLGNREGKNRVLLRTDLYCWEPLISVQQTFQRFKHLVKYLILKQDEVSLKSTITYADNPHTLRLNSSGLRGFTWKVSQDFPHLTDFCHFACDFYNRHPERRSQPLQ